MPAGRPTDYKEEFVDQVRELAILGATDADIAKFFKIQESTLNNWKHKYPEFLESLRAGKDEFDSEQVEQALKKRAMGFRRSIEKPTKEGVVMCYEEIPPDTTACIFWLKNRQSQRWRDRQEIEHSTPTTISVTLSQKPK